jgi:hypothetical protein
VAVVRKRTTSIPTERPPRISLKMCMGKLSYGDIVETVAISEIDKVYVSIHLYLRAKLLNYPVLYLAKLWLNCDSFWRPMQCPRWCCFQSNKLEITYFCWSIFYRQLLQKLFPAGSSTFQCSSSPTLFVCPSLEEIKMSESPNLWKKKASNDLEYLKI